MSRYILLAWCVVAMGISVAIAEHVNPPPLQHGWSSDHVFIENHNHYHGPNGELRT